jgi:dynein light intermediate chain 1, cytosolic
LKRESTILEAMARTKSNGDTISDGASLIYTTSFDPNNVRTLIHSSLGIQSPLKRETVRHNVIDRDKILIPPNWDSWGKIRILREDFEMEKVANAWSVEIQSPPEAEFDTSTTTLKSAVDGEKEDGSDRESAVSIFTSSLPNPIANSKPYVSSTATDDVVTVQDPQTFLAEQAQILESLRQEDERAERRARKGAPTSAAGGGSLSPVDGDDAAAGRARIPEPPTGPYNINVGGMQVDAEEVTKRIREREADRDRDRDGDSNRTPRKEAGASGSGSGMATPEGGKMQNEALASYFAGLLKKAKGSSESPRGGSGSATER